MPDENSGQNLKCALDLGMKVGNLREESAHAEGEGDQERSQGVEEILRGQPFLLKILKIRNRGCERAFFSQ